MPTNDPRPTKAVRRDEAEHEDGDDEDGDADEAVALGLALLLLAHLGGLGAGLVAPHRLRGTWFVRGHGALHWRGGAGSFPRLNAR